MQSFFRVVPAWMVLVAVVGAAGAVCFGQATTSPAGQSLSVPEMTLLDLLMKGGWYMIPIAIGSLIGLALVIERLLSLRQGKIIPKDFLPGLKGVFDRTSDNRQAGLEYCKAHDSPIARVVAAGINRLARGNDVIERAIEDAGALEVSKLRRNLRLLYAVAAIEPLLGLLGTVSGMIKAFQVASAGGLGRAELLAKGIYEALVTTFAGLNVAIPVLIFYYYFLGKIDQIVNEMNDASVSFVEHYTTEGLREASAERQASAAEV